jgi:hypothetical protein
MLLSDGFRRLAVAVGSDEPELEEFLDRRGRALCEAMGASLELIREARPLGTIGAARLAIGAAERIVVVNVDNLTSLSLQALAAYHRERRAALTIATHVHPFRIPFGELVLDGGRVTRYLEKPARCVQISSGTYVLERRACMFIGRRRRTDVPELVSILLEKGEPVVAFQHSEPWIDVNDAAAVHEAGKLLLAHECAFERWRRTPDGEMAALVMRSPAGVLVERSTAAACRAACWEIPLAAVTGSGAEAAIEAAVSRRLACRPRPPLSLLASFDEVDTTTRRLNRYHIFVADVREPALAAHPGIVRRWIRPEERESAVSYGPVLSRALARLASRP